MSRPGPKGNLQSALAGVAPPKPLGSPSESPCTNVCRIDDRRGWCLGCYRTLDEIAAWSAMADAQKLAIHQALPARRAAAMTELPGEGGP